MHLTAEHPVVAGPTRLHNDSGSNSTVNEQEDDVPPYIVVRAPHHEDSNTFDTCRAAGHDVFCCHFGADQNGHIMGPDGHWGDDAACVRSECFSGRRRRRGRKRTLTCGQRTSTGRAATTTRSTRRAPTAATTCTTSPRPATRRRSAVLRSGSVRPMRSLRRMVNTMVRIEPRATECEPCGMRHAACGSVLSVETIVQA